MKLKTRLTVFGSATAAVALAGSLTVAMSVPASSTPRVETITETLTDTVDRLEAEANKLTKAEKDALVKKYDHPMGSQIDRVEGTLNKLTGNQKPTTAGSTPRAQSKGAQAEAKAQTTSAPAAQYGIDVSGHQGNVDWNRWWHDKKRFAYIKATEGTGYKNPYFAQQYNGSYNKGFVRGSYHFALPNKSYGSTQAKYFVNNGGGWSRDGKTLPGALDIEWNPYGSACYGKTKAQMRAWIKAFRDQYRSMTGRWPTIYSSTSYWNQCIGSGHGFQKTSPLWVARYNSSVGTLPPGYSIYTFWQYSDSPIDQNRFNGSLYRLKVLAKG